MTDGMHPEVAAVLKQARRLQSLMDEQLDKMAGEPVDVRVNGVLLASGEVIVLDDVFGVRITRLHNRVDRADTFGD